MTWAVAGVSHKTAALAVRERLAVPRSKHEAALRAARAAGGCDEAVLVSTCNRVEVYVAGGEADARRSFAAALSVCGRSVVEADAAGGIYTYQRADATRHLFRVAASLDSMVPGEAQIVGQVREAFEAARLAGTLGPHLDGLYQRALRVARAVRTRGGLHFTRPGIAETAADHAERLLGGLTGKSVLCIGTGKMSSLLLRHIHRRGGERDVVVIGRDLDRADDLARRYGGRGGIRDEFRRHLARADVLVSGTGHPGHVVHADAVAAVMAGRPDRPLLVVDLAVPRDVDPACRDVAGVHLFDLDDLQQATRASAKGLDEVDEVLVRAEAVVEEAVARQEAYARHRETHPTIARLYARGHATAAAEAARLAAKLPADLTPDQRDRVARQAADTARRIVNKLLHNPVVALRHAPHAPHAPHSPHAPHPHHPHGHNAYRHAVEKLFALGDADETPETPNSGT